MTPLRLCLWSGPRNLSTALMYSFAQRSDTQVVDEPLYAHYLSKTSAHTYHPGAAEVLACQENDGEKVVQELILGRSSTPVLFFKNMTHHLTQLDWGFLAQTVNILLTRDPREMLPSYAEQVSEPQLHDTGYADHLCLWDYLRSLGQQPVVLEARRLLENPQGVLMQLCERVGLSFDEQMLRWPIGPRPEDGCWAHYWYGSVHRSSGFAPYRSKTTPFPSHLEPLYQQCLPYYEALAQHSLQ